MINSSEAELLDQVEGAGGKRFNKREGWYSQRIEDVEEQENVQDPDNGFTEYNMKCRIVNGPSKGVEFIRIGFPIPKVDANGEIIELHPDFRAKVYGPDNKPVLDAAGEPEYERTEGGGFVPNGRFKRVKGLFEDVMTAVFVGDAVKGRGDEAKAKRKAIINEAVDAAGNIAAALVGKVFIVKMRMDRGERFDQNSGEMVTYSPSLKAEPRLKPGSFMSYSEEREKKYVLDPKNMAPPTPARPTAPKVDLKL